MGGVSSPELAGGLAAAVARLGEHIETCEMKDTGDGVMETPREGGRRLAADLRLVLAITPTTTPTGHELAELVRALRADAEQTRPLCVPGADGDQARGERNAYRDAADRIERALQVARGDR